MEQETTNQLHGMATPCGSAQHVVPVLLMVSGGSDSEAMLEIAVRWSHGADGELEKRFSNALPAESSVRLHVLHVNHMLRGKQADDDAAFVEQRCKELNVPCVVKRVDVAQRARESKDGIEAVARIVRYELAETLIDELCVAAHCIPEQGVICTAHTLDDRVETYFMRSLVGTGPGGLASIPRKRGHVVRPLLDVSREELRTWLRSEHAGIPDAELWCDDSTNDDGSNFRSRVRCELMPVLRELRPGFEKTLARTMDLIADEEADRQDIALSIVYRNLRWDGVQASLPIDILVQQSRSMQRRILRSCLLVVNPQARLEASQLDRVLDGAGQPGFATEVSGGIRVRVVAAGNMVEGGTSVLEMRKV